MGQLVRVPANETQRLLAVRSLNAVHSSPTPELATLAELARGVFETPYAAINIIDEDWQRIAGQAGLKIAECSRDMSICTRVVFDDELLVIPDLVEDSELKAAPFVLEDPYFRFYAGAPVRLENGLPVGAFCILDQAPRRFKESEQQSLMRFAQIASALLRLQKTNLLMGIAESGLRTAAMTDPLTRFFNRSALEGIVDGALSAAIAGDRGFGALYLDMDGFKAINDRFGHNVGDEVLCEAAARIRSVIRIDDIVVRMGGDEFAIFVPDLPEGDTLVSLSERLLAAFRAPFIVDGGSIFARLSIGAAAAPQDGATRISLLRNVDAALYKAKAAGRDRVAVFGS
ncbi:Putative diguanylate cyclase [Rhizobium freirei PRF 81]|uniref:Putative diguanylate cyclase n=1 Tax=Rhizobium freirei PRF 81 TaxID=363754 RepID=N6V5D9_9HYPH|nr:sensor domain-containing diguanylate cyclase [Rhizobium freirei]ENN89040.1 Putative diguanylate cyclase [Rhizobium freirei PRF 81]